MSFDSILVVITSSIICMWLKQPQCLLLLSMLLAKVNALDLCTIRHFSSQKKFEFSALADFYAVLMPLVKHSLILLPVSFLMF